MAQSRATADGGTLWPGVPHAWQHRTRTRFAETIRASSAPTRGRAAALSKVFGKEVSRDTIAALRGAGFLASGPRSPTPGAPYTYVTTKHFLSSFGMETLRDLPDIEALEDAGLLSRQAVQYEPLSAEGESEEE